MTTDLKNVIDAAFEERQHIKLGVGSEREAQAVKPQK
jgi:hypothetical protein